jgi:DNA-binding SARP family transcriptional activator
VFERERLRQRVLHAVEALSRLLVRAGRPLDGIRAARSAVVMDPLRESAQRTLVESQLAVGDVAGARRSYATYRAATLRRLGTEPTAELAALLHAGLIRFDRERPARWTTRTAAGAPRP